MSIVTIIITSGLVALGMAGYARIQRWCLYIGLVGLALMFVLMLVSTQDDVQGRLRPGGREPVRRPERLPRDDRPGAPPTAAAYTGSELDPLGVRRRAPCASCPFMLFFLLYPNWGATLYGEVRGAGDFRKVLHGMLGGLWVTVALAIVFVLLAAKTFGWTFFNASNVTYVNYAYVYSTTPPPMPIWGYPPMLASFLIDSHIIQAIIVFAFGAWWLGWTGTLFLSSTRMIFAAAFDRVLPEWAARVSERGPCPWAALALIMIPSVFLSWLYAYDSDFYGLTLDATLVIAVTFFGSVDRRDDPAVVEEGHLRRLAGRALQDRGLPLISGRRAITDDLPRLGDLPRGFERPALRDRCRQHQLDHVPRRRSTARRRCCTSSRGCIAARRASTSTPSIRRSRRSNAGFLADSSEAPRTPRRLSIRVDQPPNQPVGPGEVFCHTCLASRYSSRPLGPSSRPMPDCLKPPHSACGR